MDILIFPFEGARFFARKIRIRMTSPKKYPGDAEEICERIVKDCWNSRYFQTSTGNFCEFWTRDFSYCTQALIGLGYRKEVISTLEYALGLFRKHDRIATTISPGGAPFDVFTYSPDSLPLLLKSVREAGAKSLVEQNRDFLNRQISRYFRLVIDNETGLVRKKWFSSIKDNAKRDSSMYDNTMVALLSKEADAAGLDNPLGRFDYKKILADRFWTGDYFRESLSSDTVSGDANLFPFWTGVFEDRKMLLKCLGRIEGEGLASPFPLKYTATKQKPQMNPLLYVFAPNYEGDTIWAHMGMLFIEMAFKADKSRGKEYLARYRDVIGKNRNFFEVFNPDGTLFRTLFYHADEGMLWASMYLWLKKKEVEK